MTNIQEWLNRFLKNEKGITLTFKNKTIKKSDCIEIGKGSQKIVFKIKDSSECFFIPHKYSTEENWNNLIDWEKLLLDQLSDLGLRTQHFEIIPLTINMPDKPPYTINVLLTKDFERVCQEENIVIYNVKGDQQVIGASPHFTQMNFEDKEFTQKMFKKIINEYALAFTFSLPSSIRKDLDDSEHYCFELSHDINEPPVARYIYWDVVGDGGFLGKKFR